MALSLSESQAINEIARVLYEFLPGNAHPYANQELSMKGAAHRLGLVHLWKGGSKMPAIALLLERTLTENRGKFCPLIVEITRLGMTYRQNKGIPITREEIVELNNLVARVGFKIPEMWSASFLESLPSASSSRQSTEKTLDRIDRYVEFRADLARLVTESDPQARGYSFEKFLQRLFAFSGLTPRSAFRLTGEQIDGSFQLDTDTYLVEAKWHDKPIGYADLAVFREKVVSKASWSRGLFISHGGFTSDGLEAFSKGHSTNIIGMNGQDLYLALERGIPLGDLLRLKARRTAETGVFLTSILDLDL